MKNGEYFNIPETLTDHQAWWDGADELTDEMVPDWMREHGHIITDYRYGGNTSWASLSQDEQDGYFRELEALRCAPGVILDGDDSDGCVHHICITRPLPVPMLR